ncbi:hypothetical protein C8Q77DRAFT_1132446 [Trametes polyzona]|nr:hypothetical protein C8Q77DRAFT_1132446 [Trametes polyzona]
MSIEIADDLGTWGTRSEVIRARLEIQDDIAVYLRAIADLRSQLNALTPVGRLLPELLSEIFVCVAQDDYLSFGALYSRFHFYRRSSWSSLPFVCRLFYATTLATPRYWNKLPLTRSAPFTKLLARSKGVPLYAVGHIDQNTHVEYSRALNGLILHSDRLQELRITGHKKSIQTLCSKFTARLDILERLVLQADLQGSDGDYSSEGLRHEVVPIVAESASTPRLRHLELRGLSFRWSDGVLLSPFLTSIRLYGKIDEHYGTVEELLFALQAVAPRLEIMHLEDVFPLPGPGTSSDVGAHEDLSPILFQSLREAHLEGDTLRVAFLLNRVVFPSTVVLRVSCKGCDYEGVDDLLRALTIHFPPDTTPLLGGNLLLAGHDEDRDGRQTTSESTMKWWISPERMGDPSFCLIQSAGNGLLATDILSLALSSDHSSRLFGRVETLTIGWGLVDCWPLVLTCFPNLQELMLGTQSSSNAFLASLTELVASPSPDSEELPASPRYCRLLRQITFVSFGSLEGILDMATSRHHSGLPLQRIVFFKCMGGKYDKDFLRSLKKVVADVVLSGGRGRMASDTHSAGSTSGSGGSSVVDASSDSDSDSDY